jgi:hypothetical protein
MTDFFTRSVIFPTDKLAEAEAYKAWCDLQEQTATSDPGAIFTLIALDKDGQHRCAYYGPNYTRDGISFVEEPVDGPAMRADGVLSDVWFPPEE